MTATTMLDDEALLNSSTWLENTTTIDALLWWNSTNASVLAADPDPTLLRPVWEIVVISVVACVLSFMTFGGNVMVMISFRLDPQLQTVSNYFLLSLAVADVTIGAISMPLYTVYIVMNRWVFQDVICDTWLSIDYTMSNASVLNLLIISFDRYFSVTRPLTYRAKRTPKRAAVMISCAWIISMLLWTPLIIAWPLVEGRKVKPGDCSVQFIDTNPYITFATAIAAFFLPVAVMCVLYFKIFLETEKRRKDLAQLQASSTNDSSAGGSKKSQASSDDGTVQGSKRSRSDSDTGEEARGAPARGGACNTTDRTVWNRLKCCSMKFKIPVDKDTDALDDAEDSTSENTPGSPLGSKAVSESTTPITSARNSVRHRGGEDVNMSPAATLDCVANKLGKDKKDSKRRRLSKAFQSFRHHNGRTLSNHRDEPLPDIKESSVGPASQMIPLINVECAGSPSQSGGTPVTPLTPATTGTAGTPPDGCDDCYQDGGSGGGGGDNDEGEEMYTILIKLPDLSSGGDEKPTITMMPLREVVEHTDTDHTDTDPSEVKPLKAVAITEPNSIPTPAPPPSTVTDGNADTAPSPEVSVPTPPQPLSNSGSQHIFYPEAVRNTIQATKVANKLANKVKTQRQKKKRAERKQDAKAAKTLTAILLAFIITWTPYNVFVLIRTFCREECISEGVYAFGYYLCYINSTINPMCYALCNANFRRTFKRILTCRWREKKKFITMNRAAPYHKKS